MTAITGWRAGSEFPFPIVKFMDYYTLIFAYNYTTEKLTVYEAYCGTDDVWVATAVLSNFTIAHVPSSDSVISSLDVADFGIFYMMTFVAEDQTDDNVINTVGSYIRKPGVASGTNAVQALPLYSAPRAFSCCNFNGQAILGGTYNAAGAAENEWTQLGRCSVAWSGIGKFDFRPSEDKTAGFRKMPWSKWDNAHVYKVAKLGNAVMVYGNYGRASLVPYSSKSATGFGLKEDSGHGIKDAWSVSGDEKLHGFIDINNEFWIVDPSMNFQKLGYKEFIDDMRDRDGHGAFMGGVYEDSENYPIVVTYDPKGKRFYIAGFRDAYVLTEFGLYSTHQSVTSMGYTRAGVLAGFVKDIGDYKARVVVDDKDFKARALKTIDVLEYGVDYPGMGVGTELAPVNCCTDPNSDLDNTNGWTYSGGGGIDSQTGGVRDDADDTSYRLSLTGGT